MHVPCRCVCMTLYPRYLPSLLQAKYSVQLFSIQETFQIFRFREDLFSNSPNHLAIATAGLAISEHFVESIELHSSLSRLMRLYWRPLRELVNLPRRFVHVAAGTWPKNQPIRNKCIYRFLHKKRTQVKDR